MNIGDIIDGRRVIALTEGHIEKRKKVRGAWYVEMVRTHVNIFTEPVESPSKAVLELARKSAPGPT